MDFDEWDPVYEAILTDFGFPRQSDERVRDRMVSLLADAEPLGLDDVDFDGDTVAIAGAAPSLREEIDVASGADRVVAASAAADVLRSADVEIDLQVTDLDGTPETTRELAAAGTSIAVHAHGDNAAAIEEWIPRFDADIVLPTTQAAPVGPVVNPGGFTDGDRAAFLADHVGAAKLVFPGWDFDDETVDSTKARKLAWAERLLYWLERRRGERFAVLDGRRTAIDAGPLPIE